MDFPRFFIVDFPLKFLENIVIVDFPFSFYSGFSFIVDFHGTRICISKNLLGMSSSCKKKLHLRLVGSGGRVWKQ